MSKVGLSGSAGTEKGGGRRRKESDCSLGGSPQVG